MRTEWSPHACQRCVVAGNSQAKLDANTSAIEMRTTVVGTNIRVGSGVRSTMLANGQSDMTLTGIRRGQRMLNGVATILLDIQNCYGDTVRQIHGIISETAADLMLPSPELGAWPFGTFTILQSPGMDVDTTTLIHMTFNGTRTKMVKYTSDFGTMTCRETMGTTSPDGGCSPSSP
jgi:hypothetical protein